MSRQYDLDLVEVADKAAPPVCRIMDYGKYQYEAQQRAKESRKKSTNVVVKEMKYRPKIGGGDFDTKTRKVEKFLGEGHKVKITIMFRGREVYHPELGKKILDQVAEQVAEIAKVEIYPRLDGRNMTMVLAPDRKKQQQQQRPSGDRAKPREHEAEHGAGDPAPTAAAPAAEPVAPAPAEVAPAPGDAAPEPAAAEPTTD